MDLSLKTETFGADDTSWLGSRHGIGECPSVTLDTSTFTEAIHYPDGFFKSGLPLGKITATGKYGPYASQTNEVQTVTITGAPTDGDFPLTWSGQTTGPIDHDATAAEVQTALEALSNINPGDVTVTGGPGPGTAFTVTFGGQYTGTDVAAMTADGSGLSGGTAPDVTIATTTAGGAAPGTSDGRETLVGFLFAHVGAPADTTTDVVGAMLDHGKVVAAKLPVPIDSAARADVAGRIIIS